MEYFFGWKNVQDKLNRHLCHGLTAWTEVINHKVLRNQSEVSQD